MPRRPGKLTRQFHRERCVKLFDKIISLVFTFVIFSFFLSFVCIFFAFLFD